MPSTINGLPVPLDTDPVTDGAQAIRDLVAALNSRLGRRARGTVDITLSNNASGTATITFPAGVFTAAPTIFVTKQQSDLPTCIPRIVTGSVTTMGASINLYDGAATSRTGTCRVAWEAVQG